VHENQKMVQVEAEKSRPLHITTIRPDFLPKDVGDGKNKEASKQRTLCDKEITP